MPTNTQLIERLYRAKADTERSRPKRTDATYAALLTEGQNFINRTLGLLRKEFPAITLAAETREYAIASDFVAFPMDRLRERGGLVYWDDGFLEPTEPERLDVEETGWRGLASGTPTAFYLQVNDSAGTSNIKLGLHRKPNAAFVADVPSLTYYGVYRPTAITANANLPFNNNPLFEDLHPLLLEYALHMLEIEDGNLSKQQAWLEDFVGRLDEARSWIPGLAKPQKGFRFDREWRR